jgi:hypothetical protein
VAAGSWIVRSPVPTLAIAGLFFAAVTWWVYGTPVPGRQARQQLSPVVETEAPTIMSVDPEPAAEREIYRARPSTMYTQPATSSNLAEPVWSAAADTTATATSSVAIDPERSAAFAIGDDGLPQMVPPPAGLRRTPSG